MSYASNIDFLALLRQTTGGMRIERMPGLDYVVVALARANLFTISVGQTAPTLNQPSTVWVRPSVPSWAGEASIFLWNIATAEYEPATPALWSALFVTQNAGIVQDVTTAGPVAIAASAGIVRVQNVGVPVALVMGLSVNASRSVLISDWANHAGTNPITITLSGGDVFPGGGNTWIIGADTGSVFLRPVPGGYAL